MIIIVSVSPGGMDFIKEFPPFTPAALRAGSRVWGRESHAESSPSTGLVRGLQSRRPCPWPSGRLGFYGKAAAWKEWLAASFAFRVSKNPDR